jgi:ribulose-phosphate 3-epimerase
MDIKVGLAVNVETTIEQVRDILPTIDHLVVFTGKLGHNGGEFRADCLEKISQARAVNSALEIAVDGGLNQETSRLAIEAGADLLDVGLHPRRRRPRDRLHRHRGHRRRPVVT